MKNQPLLTSFPSTVLATAKRRLQASIRQARDSISQQSLSGYALMFEQFLPAGFLRSIDPTQRQRSFGHVPVFWAWLAQILEANASCQKALGLLQAWYQAAELPVPHGTTSSYCQARLRLHERFLEQLAQRLSQQLESRIRPEDRWHGLTLKAFDGSAVQLMDTPANQRAYPQPCRQAKGCGFPTMGVVGLLNLSHGGWEDFVTCHHTEHDLHGASRLLSHVNSGDLILADRAFCSYELIARIQQGGGHVLMRLHQARHKKLDWRKGRKISARERIVTWKKPSRPPGSALSSEQWNELPSEMSLRYIKMKFEDRSGRMKSLVLVTDLLNSVQHDALEMADLYARRWEIELRLRDVKTTLGMEHFAVQSPDMAHKTLRMLTIAYNLIRAIMQQAAIEADKPLVRISFKGIVDLATSSHESFRPLARKPRKRAQHYNRFLAVCATKLVDLRPGRLEPRAVKRRRKNFQFLTAPRDVFREIPHRSTYKAHA